LNLTVIILTFDSESSLAQVVGSCRGLNARIIVVDSFSRDGTLALARELGCETVQHAFENYSAQRNWSQAYARISDACWVLHLDADEVLAAELAESIRREVSSDPADVAGFLVRRLTFFMGHPIRYGHTNPSWHLRLFRAGKGRCEDRLYDQHFIADGATRRLCGELHDLQQVSLERWTQSHNRWSTAEAREVLDASKGAGVGVLAEDLNGDPRMRKRWYKNRLYYRSPLLLRAFPLFIYSYFFRLGFLDGRVGLIYHVLQCFWFRFLVDAKIEEELRRSHSAQPAEKASCASSSTH